jgi:SAM-dependent methyltransferase
VESNTCFWHARYQQQAKWTIATRRYLFEKIGIHPHERILEVGCGSGAVLETLAGDGFRHLSGVDKDLTPLIAAQTSFMPICANGMALPFPSASFTHTLCHFYLMWTASPHIALDEMCRVTQPGGWVLALAEPDYGGRISSPPVLERLAELQTQSLENQGAHVRMGSQLRSVFLDAGLEVVHGGIIAAEWAPEDSGHAFSEDREILAHDLRDLIGADAFDDLMKEAKQSTAGSGATWYVPIFYAFGRVPGEKEG